MRVCGQTLVLLDNDATLGPVSQKIAKATLKYMFYHLPEDRAFCLSTYEHDVSEEESFTGDANDLMCTLDGIEFGPKDSNLGDTLCEVILRWRSSDFACRDIVVFTDGLEGGMISHEKEELYYLLEKSGYPVYVVMLDQEDNAAAKKGLSAVAVTSGGRLFESEFEGSDAEVDRQLTEMVFSAMDEYSRAWWSRYEEEDEPAGDEGYEAYEETDGYAGEDEGQTYEEEYGEYDEIGPEEYMEGPFEEEGVVYEYERTPHFFAGTGALILSAALVLAGLTAGILGGFAVMKKKRSGIVRVQEREEEFFGDFDIAGTTVLDDGDAGSTRLLYENGRVVTLTGGRASDGKYTAALSYPMTVGRGDCDVVIDDDALSRRHFELYEDDGSVFVRDLKSANGTRVNGVRVSEKKLSDGDRLTAGAYTYVVGIE